MFRGTNAQDAFEASVAVNELLKSIYIVHSLYRPTFWNMPNILRKTVHVLSIIWIQEFRTINLYVLIN